MSDTGSSGFGGTAGQSGDGKEKIGVPNTKATPPGTDDPSRSALHYGEDHRGTSHHTSASQGDANPTDAAAPGAGLAFDPGPTGGQSGGPTGASGSAAALPRHSDPASSSPGATAAETGPVGAQVARDAEDVELGADPATLGPVEPGQGATPQTSGTDPGTETRPGIDSEPDTVTTFARDAASRSVLSAETSGAAETDPSASALGQTPPAAAHASGPANAAPTDIDLSNGAIAASAEGAIVGSVHAIDADAGDLHSYTVSDDRFEVFGGVLRLRAGQSLDDETEPTVSIEVTATDPSGQEVSKSFEIEVVDMPELSTQTGFHARYFDVDQSLQHLHDIDWTAAPTHQERVDDINYENGRGSFWEGGATDTFGAQITGHVEVDEAGTFTFELGGDDGAVLFVNGVEVIENDGLHSYHTRSGEIDLAPGTHHIEVRYFENYGHAGLKLEWEGPGIDGQQLVTAPGLDNAQTVNGMPLTLELALDPADASDSTTLTIEGLPEGTLINAGADAVTVGADGTADVTGLDMSLVTMTAPVDFTGPIDAEIVTRVTTESGQTAIASDALSIQVNPATIEPMPVAMVGGFEASYYAVDETLHQIDDIDWSAPATHTEMVREINYENGRGSFWDDGDTDTFGAKLDGMIRVEEGGSYQFHLGGDDGVVLFINGVEVIEHDGLHAYQTRSGEIDLEPGTHHVEVRYFENYGYAGLKLEWDGPGTDGRELVQADPDLSVPENGMLTVGIETDALSDAATVQVHGLPAHTIVMSDGESAVSDGGPVDLSGWNIDAIEIAPPPGYEGQITGQIVLEDTAFNGEMMTSTSEFAISVGDAGDGSAGDGSDGTTPAIDASGSSENEANLLVLDGSDDAGDTQEDDVLDQPVEQTADTDCVVQPIEAYERCDW